MLNASADDLIDLHGVGPKRRSQLVEMVVDLAVDGVDEPVEVEAEAVPEVAPEASEPTPDELLAAAYDPLHASVPTQSSPYDPALVTPAVTPKRPPKSGKVFKQSAIITVASFVLFGLYLQTFDPEAESFIAVLLAIGVVFGGLTAGVSGVVALISKLRS